MPLFLIALKLWIMVSHVPCQNDYDDKNAAKDRSLTSSGIRYKSCRHNELMIAGSAETSSLDRHSISFDREVGESAMKPGPHSQQAQRNPLISRGLRSDRPSRKINATGAHQVGDLSGASGTSARQAPKDVFAHLPASQKLQLARRLGYDSFASLLAASTVVTLSDGSTWWLTADRFGGWTAWNLCAIDAPHSQSDDSEDVATGANGR